jgi:hypothetical protein
LKDGSGSASSLYGLAKELDGPAAVLLFRLGALGRIFRHRLQAAHQGFGGATVCPFVIGIKFRELLGHGLRSGAVTELHLGVGQIQKALQDIVPILVVLRLGI